MSQAVDPVGEGFGVDRSASHCAGSYDGGSRYAPIRCPGEGRRVITLPATQPNPRRALRRITTDPVHPHPGELQGRHKAGSGEDPHPGSARAAAPRSAGRLDLLTPARRRRGRGRCKRRGLRALDGRGRLATLHCCRSWLTVADLCVGHGCGTKPHPSATSQLHPRPGPWSGPRCPGRPFRGDRAGRGPLRSGGRRRGTAVNVPQLPPPGTTAERDQEARLALRLDRPARPRHPPLSPSVIS